MAVTAFVLIDVAGDHTRSAHKTITRLEGVKAVYTVSGPYDLIVQIEAPTFEQLSEIIISRIRAVDGVTKTNTSIVLQA